jgi:hypothetical protein
MAKKGLGTCKLSGVYGTFVRAHLIPKAVTRPDLRGAYFIQAGKGSRPSKRFDSWYDEELVTRKGEDVLTTLDTWAISELRRHKLIWSGWGDDHALRIDDHVAMPDTAWGARSIDGIDAERLRLFFLSLLWRAAATTRPEFSEVTLGDDELIQLQEAVLRRQPPPDGFYPLHLIQLSTKGEAHNQTPVAMTKHLPADGDDSERLVPIYRFYFEGLIAHFIRPPATGVHPSPVTALAVDRGHSIIVTTITYEGSFQQENLARLKFEAFSAWPAPMTKLMLSDL